MKNITIYGLALILVLSIFAGCDDYLDQTPDATVEAKDIFGNYEAFQGFVDKQYAFIWDAVSFAAASFPGFGDDFVESKLGAGLMARGEYMSVTAMPYYYSRFTFENRNWASYDPSTENNSGIWPSGWRMIRDANLALKNLDMLIDATEEERRLIEGQAIFFRAYHHYNYVINYGGMPYVDKYAEAEDDVFVPRMSTWETIERIVEDLDKAAELLPVNWNETESGRQNLDKNVGRITKGACIGLKAKILLYAGSPTFVLESTGELRYDNDYLRRAAEAAVEVLELGEYSLVPWEEYYLQFGRNDGFVCWSSETILACQNWAKGRYVGYGSGAFNMMLGRSITPLRFAGTNSTQCVSQNMVEMYEMANGLPIDDPDSGFEPLDPWSNRDPRFRGNTLVDQDEWTFKSPQVNKFEMYKGGRDNTTEFRSPFIIKKYWPKGVNTYDKQWDLFTMSSPNLRLAEVYLIYAEAVNEISGPNGTIAGSSMTAVEAVNIVRARAGMPPVASKFLDTKDNFRERIWNERAVELFGEDGTRWYDLRRWHVAHLDKHKICYGLEFDKEHTYFNKVVVLTKVFEEKHYWCPVPPEVTQVYPGFKQNPGW